MPAPVALGDSDDELLADVPGKVEVDVGDGGQLPVQEAADREAGVHGVDGRARSGSRRSTRPSCPGRGPVEQVARRARPSDLGGHVAGQLQDLPVEEEEA